MVIVAYVVSTDSQLDMEVSAVEETKANHRERKLIEKDKGVDVLPNFNEPIKGQV